jgi:hypothetical protein
MGEPRDRLRKPVPEDTIDGASTNTPNRTKAPIKVSLEVEEGHMTPITKGGLTDKTHHRSDLQKTAFLNKKGPRRPEAAGPRLIVRALKEG